MTNLKDLLSVDSLENLTASQAVEGSVFRMHLGSEEGVINHNLPKKRQNAHYRILAKANAFLNGTDRYVDCSDFKVITKKRFAELFGKEKAKGTIDQESLTAIKQITSNYEDASPKLLKRFGLL